MKSCSVVCHLAVDRDSENRAFVSYWAAATICDDPCVVEGQSLNDLFKFINCGKVSSIYFHDFDFESTYIINWLFMNGYVCTDNRQVSKKFSMLRDSDNNLYFIKVCNDTSKVEIRGSRNKLRSSVKDIALGFLNTDTNIVDYCLQGTVDKDMYYDYVYCVALALNEMFNDGLKKLTTSGDARQQWKNTLDVSYDKLFPILSHNVNKYLRNGYKGGFVWCKDDIVDQQVGKGIVFDYNSMYSSMMRFCPLPYGEPHYFTGDPADELQGMGSKYYCGRAYVTAHIKEDHIPCICCATDSIDIGSVVKNDVMDDINGELLYLTNFDELLLNEQYDVDAIDWLDGYWFNIREGMFDKYIDKWHGKKSTSIGGKRAVSKLMLESLYGGFGIKDNKRWVVPEIVNGIVRYKEDESKKKNKEAYLPVAMFTTAMARAEVILTAQKYYDRLIYIDTDSMHLLGDTLPDGLDIDPVKLGCWKIESTFVDGKYLRQKTYMHLHDDGTYVIKMSGAPDIVKNQIGSWDDFRVGAKFTGKAVMVKLVGGAWRKYSTYSIL